MSNPEFFIFVVENIWLYLGCLGFAILLYFLLFRKVYISIFDPLIIALIGSMFSFSVVSFLFLIDEIDTFYLSNYLLTQVAFIGCFLLMNRTKLTFGESFKIEKELDFNKVVFFCASSIFILSTLASYAVIGIPFFMSSRLDAAVGAGGFGILARFAGPCQFFAVYYCYHFLFNKNLGNIHLRNFARLVLGMSLIFSLLSGAKSAFFMYAIVYFFYAVTQKSHREGILKTLRKREPTLIVIVLIVAIGVVVFRGGDSISEASLELVQRFVGSGDIYWMAYPNDAMMTIDSEGGMMAIFGPLLSTVRIVSPDQVPIPIGIDLFKMYYNVDSLMGPNARHNVFGLLYFGQVGSVVFSAILGLLLGAMRSLFINSTFTSLFRTILICFIYFAMCSLEVDITYVMGEITSLIMAMTLLVFSSVFVFNFMEKKDG